MAKLNSGAISLNNMVLEAHIGNTLCIICDDSCPKGEETRKRTEQSKIHIGRIWYEAETSKQIRENDKCKSVL